MRKRIALVVHVDLDMMPGTFHTPESARETVQVILNEMIGHYTPTVALEGEGSPEIPAVSPPSEIMDDIRHRAFPVCQHVTEDPLLTHRIDPWIDPWIDPVCGCTRSPDVAYGTPCPEHP